MSNFWNGFEKRADANMLQHDFHQQHAFNHQQHAFNQQHHDMDTQNTNFLLFLAAQHALAQHSYGMAEQHYDKTGKVPSWYVEQEIGHIKDPKRKQRLREIAKKNPDWFMEYGAVSDVEVVKKK